MKIIFELVRRVSSFNPIIKFSGTLRYAICICIRKLSSAAKLVRFCDILPILHYTVHMDLYKIDKMLYYLLSELSVLVLFCSVWYYWNKRLILFYRSAIGSLKRLKGLTSLMDWSSSFSMAFAVLISFICFSKRYLPFYIHRSIPFLVLFHKMAGVLENTSQEV